MHHVATLVLAVSLFAGCGKKDAAEPITAPTPSVAPPVAAPAFAIEKFVERNVAGYDAANNRLVVFAEEVGDEEFVAIRRYELTVPVAEGSDTKLGEHADAATIASTHGKQIEQELAGLAPIAGTPITEGKGALPGGGTVAFDEQTQGLTVAIAGKPETRTLDGGGVTTVIPHAAFELPDGRGVAVLVRYEGDVIRTQELHVFGVAKP